MIKNSGPISMNDIRQELKINGPINLNDTSIRKLAGKPSGPISLSDFYGKSSTELIFDGAFLVKNRQDYTWFFEQVELPSHTTINKGKIRDLICDRNLDDKFVVNIRSYKLNEFIGKKFYVTFSHILEDDNITPIKFEFIILTGSPGTLSRVDEDLYYFVTDKLHEHFFVKIYVE